MDIVRPGCCLLLIVAASGCTSTGAGSERVSLPDLEPLLGGGGGEVVGFSPDRIIAGVNDRFTLEVHADVGHEFLAAYSFSLRWDPAVLEVEGITGGASPVGAPLAVNLREGSLRFNGVSVRPVASGSVHVATLSCRARARGWTRLAEERQSGDTLAVYRTSSSTQADPMPEWSIAPAEVEVR